MLYLDSKPLEEINPRDADDVPTLVVEVVSPSDRMRDVLRRVEQYHRRGVPVVWVVEPDSRSLHVYRPNEFPKVLDETDEIDG